MIARFVFRVHLFIPARSVADVGHTSLPASSVCCLHPCKSEHFWSWFRFAPLRLKTASAFGSIDCVLRLDVRFFPTPLLRHGVGRGVRTCGHKLSSHFHSHFTPDTSGYAYGVGFVPITVCPKPTLAFPTRKDRHLHSGLRSEHCRHPPPPFPSIRGLMNAL